MVLFLPKSLIGNQIRFFRFYPIFRLFPTFRLLDSTTLTWTALPLLCDHPEALLVCLIHFHYDMTMVAVTMTMMTMTVTLIWNKKPCHLKYHKPGDQSFSCFRSILEIWWKLGLSVCGNHPGATNGEDGQCLEVQHRTPIGLLSLPPILYANWAPIA